MADINRPPSEEQQVLLTPNGSKRDVYHTNPDCPKLPSSTREWPLSQAKRWGYTKCRFCSNSEAFT